MQIQCLNCVVFAEHTLDYCVHARRHR